MKILLYIFMGLLLCLTAISFISLKLCIMISKKENEESFHIFISLYRLKHEFILPYGDFIYDLDNEFQNSNKDKEEEKDSFINKFKNKYDSYNKFLKIIYPPVKKLAKRLKIKKLEWFTSLGISDAGATGLLSGILWLLKGQLMAFLQNIFICEDIKINITPHFNSTVFKTYLNCIIRIKIGYIIITLIKIAYLLLLKGGELSEQSSN